MKNKSLPFLKMHGIGNDFVVLDDFAKNLAEITPNLAQQLSDRRFGVGADQILRVSKPVKLLEADARMEVINADGTQAEMCGNGIRAVALYLYRYGPAPHRNSYRIETLAGLKTVMITPGRTAAEDQVTVDMGPPGLGKGVPAGEPLEVLGEKLKFLEISMGNPHAVFFVDDVDAFPVEKYGPAIENHSRFPQRTNVEFVQVVDAATIRVRVWERGTGITLACGTGACASAVASLASQRVSPGSKPVLVRLPGGDLRISWAGVGTPVLMEGPAHEVFRGDYYL